MSRVRELDRKAPHQTLPAHHATIVVIAGREAALPLRARLELDLACTVLDCTGLAGLREALAAGRPTLAIAAGRLADEARRLLTTRRIPTLLFGADPGTAPGLVEHVAADGPDALDRLVGLAGQMLRNRAIPVLVVDDQRSARAALVEILAQQNYHALEARCGFEALDILAEHEDIEMVITDYHMRDMDGLALTREIRRRRNPDRVRIIGISASDDPGLSGSFLRAGAADFIHRPFVAEEVWLRISHGLETLDQIRRLRDLAERDPLTGLYNRRAFFEFAQGRLDAQREQAGAEEDGGAVAILDIDHFKAVNDTWGHDTGDTVIRQIAGVLGRIAHRERILTARFGGEEFVLLMPGFDIARAHALCEDIRRNVCALALTGPAGRIRVSVSLGVARLRLEESIDNNLNAADQMLYMAKGGGRNQVFSDATFARV